MNNWKKNNEKKETSIGRAWKNYRYKHKQKIFIHEDKMKKVLKEIRKEKLKKNDERKKIREKG